MLLLKCVKLYQMRIYHAWCLLVSLERERGYYACMGRKRWAMHCVYFFDGFDNGAVEDVFVYRANLTDLSQFDTLASDMFADVMGMKQSINTKWCRDLIAQITNYIAPLHLNKTSTLPHHGTAVSSLFTYLQQSLLKHHHRHRSSTTTVKWITFLRSLFGQRC